MKRAAREHDRDVSLDRSLSRHKRLVRLNETSTSSPDTGQVLEHYISYSLSNDVVFYFSNQSRDWRITYLVPLCHRKDDIGLIMSNLLAALHRLRVDGSGSIMASLYHEHALRQFYRLKSQTKDNMIDILACSMTFMQYDMNANSSQNSHVHLGASAKLMQYCEARMRLPGSSSSKADGTNIHNRRFLSCLKRINHTYDLANALLLDTELYSPISVYETTASTIADLRQADAEMRSKVSIDDLWSMVHLIWARIITQERTTNSSGEELHVIQSDLHLLNSLFTTNSNPSPVDSPIRLECPFGMALLYKSPAFRLIHCTIAGLILYFCSTYPELEHDFELSKLRDLVFRAHIAHFDSSERGAIRNERYIHQVFPAIIPFALAMAEVGPDCKSGQIWLSNAMRRLKVHGFALGVLMLGVLKMVGPRDEDDRWDYVGARQFVLSVREARRSGLA